MLFFVFLTTFVLPGIVLALSLVRKDKIDFLLLIVYVGVLGLASQIANGLLLGFIELPIITPIIFLAAVIYFAKAHQLSWWQWQWSRLTFSWYDLFTILIAVVLLLSALHQISDFNENQFYNNGDALRWITGAERYLQQPSTWLISALSTKKEFFGPTFPLAIISYTPFIEKSLAGLREFTIFWPLIFYFLIAVAIARLAKVLLPTPYIGLLAPLLLFSFHWQNYFLLGLGIARQNPATFLFITGIIALNDKEHLSRKLISVYLAVFILIQYHSLLVLLGGLAIAAIIYYLFLSEIGNKIIKIAFWLGLFILINYVIYASKNYLILGQPYDNNVTSTITWLSLFGLIGILAYLVYGQQKKSTGLIVLLGTFILSLFFLFNTALPNAIIGTEFPQVRFFPFINCGLAILALIIPAIIIRLIKKKAPTVTFIVTVLVLLVFTPYLLKEVARQQRLPLKQALIGINEEKAMIIKEGEEDVAELLIINQMLKEQTPTKRNILFEGSGLRIRFADWALHPNNVFYPTNPAECPTHEICLINQTYLKRNIKLSDIEIDAVIRSEHSFIPSDFYEELLKLFSKKIKYRNHILYLKEGIE